MLRSMLVGLDESEWSESAASLAVEWAIRFDAHLVGLAVVDEPSIVRPEAVPRGAAYYKMRRDRLLLVDATKRVTATLEKFQQRCATAGISAEVVKAVGDSGECIVREAHRCDLVVLGSESHFHFETQDKPDETLGHVVSRSPRPAVVVPREAAGGTGIMVAYGSGREVARALQTVQLLGLAFGETIHLVNIRPTGRKADGLAELAAEYLKSQGTAHQLHVLESDLDPAQALLQQVEILQPRFLVMGAPGYHPLRDLFATSVTRAVLRACPVPVLIGA